jgi:2-keto-4-pentenoate hydratase
MEAEQISEAARLFVEARRTRVPIRELPPECRPANTDEANAIVREVTRRLALPIGGWKITFLYKPRQRPIIAPLFSANIFESPARIPPSVTHSLLAEPEIAFRLLEDLPPRATPYHAADVAAAVAACAALELNDTRFDTRHRSIRQMLDNLGTVLEAHADHQTSGGYVVGASRADWQDFDFAAQPLTMRCGGRVLVETAGGHAFTDPFLPVVVLANELRHRDGMKKGQIVATGSFSGFFPVEPDQPIVADFHGFGTAEATFSDR